MNIFNKLIYYIVLNLFNHIIVLAETFKQQILALGVDNKSIHVITTGVNLKDYQKVAKVKNSNNLYDILFLSRIEKTKGILEFIEAIPAVIDKFPNVLFHVVGSGNWLKTIKTHTVTTTFSNFIKIHGYLRGHKKLEIMGSLIDWLII